MSMIGKPTAKPGQLFISSEKINVLPSKEGSCISNFQNNWFRFLSNGNSLWLNEILLNKRTRTLQQWRLLSLTKTFLGHSEKTNPDTTMYVTKYNQFFCIHTFKVLYAFKKKMEVNRKLRRNLCWQYSHPVFIFQCIGFTRRTYTQISNTAFLYCRLGLKPLSEPMLFYWKLEYWLQIPATFE